MKYVSLVIRDNDEKRKIVFSAYNDRPTTKQNYDTIKLDPRTLVRLRNCYFDDKVNCKKLDTYDELLNHLMDKVEDKLK